jgi:hypothetical protein
MNAKELKLGMVCQSRQGVGVVRWIDAQDRAVYLSELEDPAKNFTVSFDELVDEPQIHQQGDVYY